MENQLNKAQLAAELGAKGIEFARDATVAQLRTLYVEKIVKKSTAPQNSDELEKDTNADDEEQKELDAILLRVPKSKAEIELREIRAEEELVEARICLLEKKKRLAELESSMFAPITQHFLKPSYEEAYGSVIQWHRRLRCTQMAW